MTTSSREKRIVLAGGGHAHLYTLVRTRELVQKGFEVTLVDASPHLYYSGMATGVISGAYAPDEHRLDLRRLVEGGGGTFVQGRVAEIQAGERTLVLEDGVTVPYDAASFCLGSEVSPSGLADDGAGTIRVKPVEGTGEIRRRLLRPGGGRDPRVLVVGGGAAGCEVAANVLVLLERSGRGSGVTIAHEGASLLSDAPVRAQESIERFLRARGAKVLTGARVVRFGEGAAWTADGREIPCDLPVLAAGVSPPDIFRASRLPVGDDGWMWVDRHLRSVGDGRLLGGGDCVSFRGKALPKLGVFAVRQGPVIFHNLQAMLTGRPLSSYKPQRRYLYVLNLGDGTGLAVYGPLVWSGRLAWKLKHRIDKRFVEKHRRQRSGA